MFCDLTQTQKVIMLGLTALLTTALLSKHKFKIIETREEGQNYTHYTRD